MSSLLYYSVSCNLSDEEILIIDQQAQRSRRKLYVFAKNATTKAFIVVSLTLASGSWLGNLKSSNAIGLPVLNNNAVNTRIERRYKTSSYPAFKASACKVIAVSNENRFTSLVYLNTNYYYSNKANKHVLKRLRGGDFYTTLTGLVVAMTICLVCYFSHADAFTFLQRIGNLNVPAINPWGGLDLTGSNSFIGNPSGSTMLKINRPTSIPHEDYSNLKKSERRRLVDPLGRDAVIDINGQPKLDLRYNQLEYKVSKHGKEFGLELNANKKTPKTQSNILAMRDALLDMPNQKNTIWFDQAQYQGGTKRGVETVNLFNTDSNIIAVYQKQPDGSNLFLTTCTLNEREKEHLIESNGNFCTTKVLDKKNWVSGITDMSIMEKNTSLSMSPDFTPTSNFENDVIKTPIDNSQGFTPISNFENDVIKTPIDNSQQNNP